MGLSIFNQLQFHSIGNVVVARGDSTESFYPKMTQGLEKKFRKSLNTVEWNPFPIDVWTGKSIFVERNPFLMDVWTGKSIFVEWNPFPVDVWTGKSIFVEWNPFHMDVWTANFNSLD